MARGTRAASGVSRIPLAARIFTVADVWDALRFERPYRKGLPAAEVLHHVAGLSGTHFDPRVVETFLTIDQGVLAAGM